MKQPARAMRRRESTAATRSEKPSNLPPAQYQFALEYLSNGCNATAAYKAVHPGCTQRTAEVNGSCLLKKAEVAAFVAREKQARMKRLQIDGDEVLAQIAMDARADITELFDEDDKILPPKEWPASIRNSIEAYQRKKDGSFRVKLVSKTMARRTILEHTDKLKSPIKGGMSALARALRADLGLDEDDT